MLRAITAVTWLVDDYDTAIDFFVGTLGFTLLEDTALDDGKRWVRVAPRGDGGTALLLARASTDAQRACIGTQTGGRVALFVESDDFAADHARMQAKGVRFAEAPRRAPYGDVVVFLDPWGNRWDLIGPLPR